jgi:hypothetical protein
MSAIIAVALFSCLVTAEQYQNDATEIYLRKLNRSLSDNYLYALAGLTTVVFVYRNTIRRGTWRR